LEFLKRFGSEVRRRRIELGLSQEDLACLCELHRTYIGSVERGERNISLVNILSISRALKTTPSNIFASVEGVQK
jgi:transcriptional regulator with XRE-family HTH domain